VFLILIALARSFFEQCELVCEELIDCGKLTQEDCDSFEPFV
jgi:hypothetical protein